MQTELLALPERDQTAETAAAIYAKRFNRIAFCLIDDGVEDVVRELLDVLHIASYSHTARAILLNAASLLRTHKHESDRDFKELCTAYGQRDKARDDLFKIADITIDIMERRGLCSRL